MVTLPTWFLRIWCAEGAETGRPRNPLAAQCAGATSGEESAPMWIFPTACGWMGLSPRSLVRTVLGGCDAARAATSAGRRRLPVQHVGEATLQPGLAGRLVAPGL